MIDLIISKNCPHCLKQLEIMQKSFFDDEYRIIREGSREYESYDARERINGFPFLVIREDDGQIKYAKLGVHDGTSLRKIERGMPATPYNLSRSRDPRPFRSMAG